MVTDCRRNLWVGRSCQHSREHFFCQFSIDDCEPDSVLLPFTLLVLVCVQSALVTPKTGNMIILVWPGWFKQRQTESISLCPCSHQVNVDYGQDYFPSSDSKTVVFRGGDDGRWQRWKQGTAAPPALGNICSANEDCVVVSSVCSPVMGNLPDVVYHDQSEGKEIITSAGGEIEEADERRGHQGLHRDNMHPLFSGLFRVAGFDEHSGWF